MSRLSSSSQNISCPVETVEKTVQIFPKFKVISSVAISGNQSLSLHDTRPTNFIFSNGNEVSQSDPPYPKEPPARKPKLKCFRHKVSRVTESQNSGHPVMADRKSEDFRFPKIIERTRKKSRKSSSTKIPIENIVQTTDVPGPDGDPASGSYFVENEYTRFSASDKLPRLRLPLKKQGVSIIRSQRLFHLMKQLRKCHFEYNKFQNLEERDQFLRHEILQRYVMTLDLALVENYLGIALEIVQKMYDATKYMIPLYSHIFYHLDATHAPLPILLNSHHNFIKSLAPVIYALNRIPFSNLSPHKNGHLRLETHLMKLQLEVLILVVAPVESAVFRATLEVLPNTAFTACQRLALFLPLNSLNWQNDSIMKKEYSDILEKIGLADQLGSKGSLATINSNNTTKSSRIINCDSELEMSDGEISDFQ